MKEDEKRTINLIINNPVIFQPKEREWSHVTNVDGEEHELRPFIAMSIIPALDWKAVFADPEYPNKKTIYKKPLACFALTQEDYGEQDVIGMCACRGGLQGPLDNAENYDHFLGFEGPGESLDWSEDWKDWHDRKKGEFKDLLEGKIEPYPN